MCAHEEVFHVRLARKNNEGEERQWTERLFEEREFGNLDRYDGVDCSGYDVWHVYLKGLLITRKASIHLHIGLKIT